MPIILPKCPDTFELNKDKCRCSKIQTKKKAPSRIKKIKLTKKTKKRIKKKVTAQTKKKRCPKGTRKNKKTGKCEKVVVLKDTTPKELKDLRKTVTKIGKKKNPKKPQSFSPNVNKVIDSLKSISPHLEIGLKECPEDKLYVKTASGKEKCVGLKSKIAQTYMIDNLLSKKPIDCDKIIAPKQKLSNCWFNSFFMVYFISDKGRKFFRYLRLAMITGKLPNGTSVAPKLRMPLLILNKYIESALIGRNASHSLATLMDTNVVIRRVARALGKSNLKKYDIAKTKQAGNPISFYEGLIQYLKSNELVTVNMTVRNMPNKKVSNAAIVKILESRPLVEYFILDRFSEEYKNNSWTIPQKYKVEKNGVTYTYVLDSAVVRDTKKQHFSAYITCNGKSFAFDGESFARMTPFEWKKKLNKNTQWRFAEQYETYFNFQQAYFMLFYYRI
tara:strand:- start:5 stop:1336 length:1332 start_codon:yes stop_codon:yes gene_type:complete